MVKRKGLISSAAKAVQAGKKSAIVDLKVEENNAKKDGVPRLLSLSQINPRPAEDTRPIDSAHVESLKESIRLLGLIQPILIDQNHCLIAGAHRLEAYKRLSKEDAVKWGKIPVVVDPDMDAKLSPELALSKEIAENEKRRNLTPSQVQHAALRLMELDPSFTRRPGRLRQGERALTPFLANTFGVSVRYIRALLNESNQKSEVSQTIKLEHHARKLKRQVTRWQKDQLFEQNPKVQKLLTQLMVELQKIKSQ